MESIENRGHHRLKYFSPISFPPPHLVLELNLFIQLLNELPVCQ